jgi:DNA-directed RNA polymerase alpha subunit
LLAKPDTMYINPTILDADLTDDLAKLNETDCTAAIKILRRRLAMLRKPDYYLSISVEDLQLCTRAFNVLKVDKLDTVMDILECGYHNIRLFRHAGPQTVNEIRNKIESRVANKNKIQGLTGAALARVIATISPIV